MLKGPKRPLRSFNHVRRSLPAALGGCFGNNIGSAARTVLAFYSRREESCQRQAGHRGGARSQKMCRNIRTLFNFDPPVTPEEIRAASLQFVRKISGFNKPSKANEPAFQSAVDEVAAAAARLVHSLETSAPPKRREEEAAKARARNLARFAN